MDGEGWSYGAARVFGERLLVPGLPGGFPADPVDGAVAGGGDDPGAGVGREFGPLLQRDGERVLDRLLGEADVTEEADQGCHAPAVLGPVDAGEIHQLKSSKGRTSSGAMQAAEH